MTLSGLEEQLLGVTIKHEQPELEQQKSTLLAAEDALKLDLEELEQRLLHELASSEGNLLENKKLIESLNELNTSALKIKAEWQSNSGLAMPTSPSCSGFCVSTRAARPAAHHLSQSLWLL